MSGVSALIDIYKMTEVSVEARIRLLHALGEIVNYELGTNATEPLIEELVALLNSNESTQARWIPVGERLPEGEKVLVLWKDGTIHLDWTFIDGGSYYWWNSGQTNVTHWMPLPARPEVQE